MADLKQDPVVNVVYDGIKKGIQATLDAGCYGSAVILIYAGIDAMAFLGMPEDQEDATSKDFMGWTERYLKFPCKEQPTPADLWGARCGMLHNYSSFSRHSRESKCRNIGYVDESRPEVMSDPGVPTLILVSVKGLAAAFYRGLDQYMVDTFANEKRAAVAEKRFGRLIHSLPVDHKVLRGNAT
jgi:hypothetical protein